MRGQDLPTLFILKKIKNKTANSKNSRVNTTKLKTLNRIYIYIYIYIYRQRKKRSQPKFLWS